MKKCILGVAMIALISLAGESVARATFTNNSLRGRYTGGVAIQENISDGNGGGTEAQGNELLVLKFDGQGGVTGTAAVAGRSLAGGAQSFSCTFTYTGTYDVTSEGLVTSTFALSSTTGCGSPTITMGMVIGGPFRTRLDVIVISVQTDPPGGVNSITGSGSLIKG
jgi:hypothetical protein